MEERRGHLTVVIGASGLAEDLRRSLVQHNVTHAGIATHLRGLRKSMVLGQGDLVVVCIALDRLTISRHGQSLRQLLADIHCFPQAVRSVGLLTDIGLDRDAAEMGCDVYVDDSAQAAKAIRSLARRWECDQVRRPVAKSGSKSVSKSGSRLRSPSRIAEFKNDDRSQAWTWGTDTLPAELAPLVAETPSRHSERKPRPVNRRVASKSARRRSSPS